MLGLAFKAGTDDLRDSPALAVIRLLEEKGAEVRAYDPMITKLDGLHVCASAKEALTGADAAIVVTAWPEFAAFDWTALSAMMRRPVLIDGRNALRGAVHSGKRHLRTHRQTFRTARSGRCRLTRSRNCATASWSWCASIMPLPTGRSLLSRAKPRQLFRPRL